MVNSLHAGLEYCVFDTEWGWIGAAASLHGLVALTLPQHAAGHALAMLGDYVLDGSENKAPFMALINELHDYLSGKKVVFEDELDLSGATPFQRQVWNTVKQIPHGHSQSYSWVAGELGKPGASRAVGQALGRNPLPIVIPCHRVLTWNGALGGFSGGLNTKKRLLALEGISFA